MKKITEVEFLQKVLGCTEDEAWFYMEELYAMGTEGFEEVYDIDLEAEQMKWARSFGSEESILDGDKKFIEQNLIDDLYDVHSDFYAVGDDF